MKVLLNIIGGIAVLLAILGIFLPLLPTTPFLLLASACYMRSSERMHRWLRENRMFGEYLRNIEDRRGIPLRAKVLALGLMWSSLAFSMYSAGKVFVTVVLALTGLGVTIYLLRMPTLRRERAERDSGQ